MEVTFLLCLLQVHFLKELPTAVGGWVVRFMPLPWVCAFVPSEQMLAQQKGKYSPYYYKNSFELVDCCKGLRNPQMCTDFSSKTAVLFSRDLIIQ